MNTKTYLLNGFCLCQLFVNTFTLTFIAEWGDRSQLATIVLAGINDVVRGVKKGKSKHLHLPSGGGHPRRVSWSRNLHGRCRLGGSANCKVFFFWRKQLVGTTLYNMLYFMYDCIIKPQVHLDQEDHLPWRSRLPWLCHRLHLHRPQRRRHRWDS